MNILYQLRHPDGGDLTFEVDKINNCIQFSCDWPFDLDTNERIAISNRFPLKRFLREIKRLSISHRVVVRGVREGEISFTLISQNLIELSVANGNATSQEELYFNLPTHARSLMPVWLDRKCII